jgi:hypothetical protein
MPILRCTYNFVVLFTIGLARGSSYNFVFIFTIGLARGSIYSFVVLFTVGLAGASFYEDGGICGAGTTWRGRCSSV